MTDRYILDEHGEPAPCEDLKAWGKWMQTAERHVARDQVGDFEVSTVFLGLSHAWHGGPPVLWETMIFGAPDGHPLDGYQERYSSRQAAVDGHARAVAAAKEASS